MNRLILVAVTLICTASSPARDLTLDEAMRLAENHSRSLRQAEENAAAADASLEAAQSSRWPNLNMTSSVMFKDEIPSFRIDLPPPAGLSIEREIGSKENYQIDVQASWPLYTGGQISGSIDMAAALQDAKRFLVEASRQELWYQTRNSYLKVIQARRLLNAAEASLKRTRLVMEDVQAMHRAGAADSVDLLEADLAVIEAEHGVDQASLGLRVAKIDLLILLGLPASDSINPTDSPAPPGEPVGRSREITRPEVKAALAASRAGHFRARIVRADLWPTLALFGGYSAGKPNQDFFNNEWNDYFSAGARLTWSFNLGGRTFAQSDAAKANYRATQHEQEHLVDQIERQAELAYARWELAWQAYLAAGRRFETTSANYRLAQDKHREGALSSNRLLEIEATLSAAESAHAAAEIDCELARTAWLYAVGSDQLKRGTGNE